MQATAVSARSRSPAASATRVSHAAAHGSSMRRAGRAPQQLVLVGQELHCGGGTPLGLRDPCPDPGVAARLDARGSRLDPAALGVLGGRGTEGAPDGDLS
jgi:hypothetical protein